MRIFSFQNMILLAFMMCANGQVMDRVPEPLRQLLGKGTAVAMSDKFDMNAMLLGLHQQRQQSATKTLPLVPAQKYQPYNFAEGKSQTLSIQQYPFPREQLEQALGAEEVPLIVREQVNEIFGQVFGQITKYKRASL